MNQLSAFRLRLLTLAALGFLDPTQVFGTVLTASDHSSDDHFAESSAASGMGTIVGARGALDGSHNFFVGAVYWYPSSSQPAISRTETAKLVSLPGSDNSYFGKNVSLQNDTALIGAWGESAAGYQSGAAYLYRDLRLATGTITQTARLRASDQTSGDGFGISVSLDGSQGLVGAFRDRDRGYDSGSAYYFANLDTATGNITQRTKLIASDGAEYDTFGKTVSISGAIALVGATNDDDGNENSGSVYLFRDLDRSSGTRRESGKLRASDNSSFKFFGYSLAQEGDRAVVGSQGSGKAYYYDNLGSVKGVATETAQLVLPDGGKSAFFGRAVALNGDNALIGNPDFYNDQAVELYLDLAGSTGIVESLVSIRPSNLSNQASEIGQSVAITEDDFVFGAKLTHPQYGSKSGIAWTGSITSITTLDEGNASRLIAGISFKSRTHWIIGENTDSNTVVLGGGDLAEVYARMKAVYIGKNPASDSNNLTIQGTLKANEVYIGSPGGNKGNVLTLGSNPANLVVGAIRLSKDNLLRIEGNLTNFKDLESYLDSTKIQVWDDGGWITVNSGNSMDRIKASYDEMTKSTTITARIEVDLALGIDVLHNPLVAGGEAMDTFRVSVVNLGPSNATGVMLTRSSSLPDGITVTGVTPSSGTYDGSVWSLDLAKGASATMTFRIQAGGNSASGTEVIPMGFSLTSTDQPETNSSNDSASAFSSVISPHDTNVGISVAPALDMQVGLFISKVTVTNHNSEPLPAFRLFVSDLPEDVRVYNAHGIANFGLQAGNLPYLLFNQQLAAGASATLTVEFFRPSLDPGFTPRYEVDLLPLREMDALPSTGGIPVSRQMMLANGDYLIEIASVPGATYAVEYSNTMGSWKRVSPTITATANRLQWIDNGPPKTESHPSAVASRFYRFALITSP